MLSVVAKFMVAVRMGSKCVTSVSSADLSLALGESLGPEVADSKFVEVALSDALTALNNVL